MFLRFSFLLHETHSPINVEKFVILIYKSLGSNVNVSFLTDPEDGRLNASSGSFASPRYQGPSSLMYANNFRATFTVSVPSDFGIIFTFSEFDLETKYNMKCLDYLEVRL